MGTILLKLLRLYFVSTSSQISETEAGFDESTTLLRANLDSFLLISCNIFTVFASTVDNFCVAMFLRAIVSAISCTPSKLPSEI